LSRKNAPYLTFKMTFQSGITLKRKPVPWEYFMRAHIHEAVGGKYPAGES